MDTTDNYIHRLSKRCVQCPPQAPACPATCPPGEICSLFPASCYTCAHMKCTPNPHPAPTSGGVNVGGIAGGVAGGIGFVVIAVFFVWLFWIKKRRAQQDKELQEEWAQDEMAQQKRSTQFRAMHPDALSTHTRTSLATSLISRASNLIQIAYIPGVTNRNGSARTSVHAPVPPIPAAYRQGQQNTTNQQTKSSLTHDGDALFFGIDDLRGSTYSAGSSVRDPRLTMHSITPSLARDSVASDVQWDDATTAPMPASSLARVAPRMVSVKSQSSSKATTPDSSSSNSSTPPEGQVPVVIAGQGANAKSSVQGKATQVTVSKGRFPVRGSNKVANTQSTSNKVSNNAPSVSSPLADPVSPASSEDDEEHARARASLIPDLSSATPSATTAQPTDSPFFDITDLPSAAIAAASSTRPNPYASMASTVGVAGNGNGARYDRGLGSGRRGGSRGKIGALSAVLEEATRRASAETGSADPFGDENEVKAGPS